MMRRLTVHAAAGGAAAVLAVWLASRLASDRWLISQYLYWLPTLVYLVAAALLLVLSQAGRGRRVARQSPAVRRITAAAWVVVLGHLFFVEFRMLNAFAAPPRPGERGAVRVLHWNVSGVRDLEQVLAAVGAEDPDVLVLADTYGPVRWREVIEVLEAESPRHTIWQAGILVISKAPLSKHGVQWLGMSGLEADAPAHLAKLGPAPNHNDPGRAMFFEVLLPKRNGSGSSGGSGEEVLETMVVWVVDLPSDWRQGRAKLARHAAQAIAAWPAAPQGPGAVATEKGPGFPVPDLVVGDFNIPRGSASLGLLTRGMRHAFDQAGWGFVATYPADWPLVHIDHAFTGPRIEAIRYRVRNPGPPAAADVPEPESHPAGGGGARHRPQVVDLIWRSAGSQQEE
jgi:hypothetical protein